MDRNTLRIVKIEKEALMEFIYENFVAQQEAILGVSPLRVMNNFALDWDEGTFIFTAHQGEDSHGEPIPFPEGINLKEVLRYLPVTTSSVLSPRKAYKEYTFDELRKILNESKLSLIGGSDD